MGHDSSSNGHDHPPVDLAEIRITFDPHHGTYHYEFKNCSYAGVIGHLEMVQLLAFKDMQTVLAAQNKGAQS